MRIRRATPADAAALAELAERTFRDAFAADNRPEDMDAFTAQVYGEAQQLREILDPAGVTLVVEDDGTNGTHGTYRTNGTHPPMSPIGPIGPILIAFTQLRRTQSSWGDVEISRFYVDRRYHGQGIAQRLMAAAYNAAKELGGETIWLGVWERNPRGIAFYKKCGFVDVGAHPFLVGSDLQTDRVMARVIPVT